MVRRSRRTCLDPATKEDLRSTKDNRGMVNRIDICTEQLSRELTERSKISRPSIEDYI